MQCMENEYEIIKSKEFHVDDLDDVDTQVDDLDDVDDETDFWFENTALAV